MSKVRCFSTHFEEFVAALDSYIRWCNEARIKSEVARLLGWSRATVPVIHSRWAKDGKAVIEVRRRGGRHHQYLNVV